MQNNIEGLSVVRDKFGGHLKVLTLAGHRLIMYRGFDAFMAHFVEFGSILSPDKSWGIFVQ